MEPLPEHAQELDQHFRTAANHMALLYKGSRQGLKLAYHKGRKDMLGDVQKFVAESANRGNTVIRLDQFINFLSTLQQQEESTPTTGTGQQQQCQPQQQQQQQAQTHTTTQQPQPCSTFLSQQADSSRCSGCNKRGLDLDDDMVGFFPNQKRSRHPLLDQDSATDCGAVFGGSPFGAGRDASAAGGGGGGLPNNQQQNILGNHQQQQQQQQGNVQPFSHHNNHHHHGHGPGGAASSCHQFGFDVGPMDGPFQFL
eukprot:TRINITY_DN68054_c6_g1_i1.p1 TRINITY_DN68054_c6_g1~~TRINITY_DN68054_c6_g1_i1.p1  ORF type:complete len:254 (+),score=54.78 TRINITY_DN68054_c6_g1_i1:41-802(+)